MAIDLTKFIKGHMSIERRAWLTTDESMRTKIAKLREENRPQTTPKPELAEDSPTLNKLA